MSHLDSRRLLRRYCQHGITTFNIHTCTNFYANGGCYASLTADGYLYTYGCSNIDADAYLLSTAH